MNVLFVPRFSTLSNQDVVFPQLTNSTQLRHAYSSVLTVTMASDQSFYEAFRQAQINREIRSSVTATEVSTEQIQVLCIEPLHRGVQQGVRGGTVQI